MANKKNSGKKSTAKKNSKSQPKLSRKSKIIIAAVSVVVVLALVASAVLAIMQSNGAFLRTEKAYQVGDETLSVADYNYYYYSSYNSFITNNDEETLKTYGLDTSEGALPLTQQQISEQYLNDEQLGSTWDDYFRSTAENTIKNTYATVALAEADEGFAVTDADKEIVEEYIQTLKDYADSIGISFADHLKKTFGPGVTEDVLRKHNLKSQIAYSYNKYMSENSQVSDEQLDSIYSEYADSLDVVSYRSFYVTSATGANSSDDTADTADTADAAADDELVAENQSFSGGVSASNLSCNGSSIKAGFMADAMEQAADDGQPSDEELMKMLTDMLGDGVTIDGINDDTAEAPDSYSGVDADNSSELVAARAIASDLAAGINSEKDFVNMVMSNVNSLLKEQYEQDDLTLHENEFLTNLSISDAKEWLSEPTRKPGDVGIVDSTSGVYIVYFISREANSLPTVNFRDIMVQPSTEISSSAGITEEQLSEARSYAENILSEFEEGTQSEDKFTLMATQYSADSYTRANGGLYSAYYSGQGYESMDKWLFDEARKPGDTTIVDGEYGVYILYYVSDGDAYWREQCKTLAGQSAISEKISEKMDSMQTEHLKGYEKTGIDQ